MKKIALVIFTLLLVKTYCQQTKIYVDKKSSNITYSMRHPLHNWKGVSNDFNSVIIIDSKKKNISQIAVSAKLSSFDSKNANRDSHMIEVAEGLKYPIVTFTSTEIEQRVDKLYITGKLSFHGVSRNITFEAIQKSLGDKVEISGGFMVKMTQFNIPPPSLMGMQTDDDFEINFTAVY